jgi:polysaccharide export outer membrane protein
MKFIRTLFVFSWVCSTYLPAQPTEIPRRPASEDRQIIGRGDSISIQAFHCEEISRTWRVGDGGEINVPMVGRVQAAGMSVEALERELASKLKRFIQDPQVSVQITEYRSQPVTVTGAVERPGVIQMQGSKKLFDVLVMVGGPKDAGETVTLTRSEKQGTIPLPNARLQLSDEGKFWTVALELADVQNRRSPAANISLMADDVVNVAHKQVKLVHIIGEVARPGSVELLSNDSVSITKLVATAGGLTRTASPKRAVIRKIGHEGVRADVAVIDLKKVMSGDAADIELSGGDVVIVPSSQLATFLTATSQSALNAGIFSGLQILARF